MPFDEDEYWGKSLKAYDETSEHTPGPWTVKRHRDSVTGDPYKTLYESHIAVEPDVCAVWAPPQNRKREANARLIGAAPDLLAALQSVAKWNENPTLEPGLPKELEQMIQAAIAKATSQPNDEGKP